MLNRLNLQAYQALKIKVPGKLYVAGEYAVLSPNQGAILVAVDHYLQIKIEKSWEKVSILENTDTGYETLHVSFEDDHLLIHGNPSLEEDHASRQKWKYVLEACRVTYQFLIENNFAYQPFHLQVSSDLTNHTGLKYGFGSSGAVTVGTLKAILAFHGYSLSKLSLFRLAVLTHLRLNNKGSFGDMASNIYGGWIYYQAPDRQWCAQMMGQELSLNDWLRLDWPSLQIEPIDVPQELQLLVGWTQSPASTENSIKQLHRAMIGKEEDYHFFLHQAHPCVLALKEGLINRNERLTLQAIHDYRQLLLDLSEAYHLPIETERLSQLIEIGDQAGYACKSSGAGGGDCGIAIGFDLDQKETILSEWIHHQIIPLNVQVASENNQ